jgi:D-glycero-alpha-D-manno-heptose-7-phosphate kinase
MGARSLARLREDGRLGLLAAVMKELALGGGRLCTRSDAPRGSGLGASSALEVAAIAAIQSGWGTAATRRAICRTAHDIELGRLHINSGQQDQYAAAFGGISFLRCRSSLRVQRCALEPAVDFARELEDALLLVYTGQTHSSGRILGSVMAAYRRGQPQIVGALRRLKEAGLQMREAVAKGDLPAVGRIMSVNWKAQKALHVPGVTPAIATPAIDAILDAAACEGAFGGKACGAGGGGCVALLVPPGRKTQLARIVEGLGGRVIPCGLDFEGLQPWHSEERQTLCAPREQPGRARVAV